MGVRIVTTSRYLGGSIGDPAENKAWIMEKIKAWNDSVEVMDRVVIIVSKNQNIMIGYCNQHQISKWESVLLCFSIGHQS